MLRVIGRHKVLLVIGIVIAALAAFATAFRVETGTLTPRVQPQYQASTQVLVSDPTSVFASKNAPQTAAPGQAAPTSRDLSSLTVVYAYLASSTSVQSAVERTVGSFGQNDSLSAAQRTTQPGSDTNTGTYRLPILEITGEAASAARAQAISRTATTVFRDFVNAQQVAANVQPDVRVQLQIVQEGKGQPVAGSSPALPIAAIGVGVLLAFLALIFAVDNVRASRRADTQAPEGSAERAPVAAAPMAPPAAMPVLPHPVAAAAHRTMAAQGTMMAAQGMTPPPAERPQPDPGGGRWTEPAVRG